MVIDGYWGFTAEGFDILPNSTTDERSVDWLWLFGELPDGECKPSGGAYSTVNKYGGHVMRWHENGVFITNIIIPLVPPNG